MGDGSALPDMRELEKQRRGEEEREAAEAVALMKR